MEDGCEGFGEGAVESSERRVIAAEGDAFFEEGDGDGGEDGREDGFMDEKGFDGVAGGRVAEFGIYEDLDGHFCVGVFVDVDRAEAVSVAENGDAGVVFDVADQVVGATGDDKVNVFV